MDRSLDHGCTCFKHTCKLPIAAEKGGWSAFEEKTKIQARTLMVISVRVTVAKRQEQPKVAPMSEHMQHMDYDS